jgi:hypothetical protein
MSVIKNTQSPIYSSLSPYDPTKNLQPSSSLNIFTPKPFRSNVDTQNNQESV